MESVGRKAYLIFIGGWMGATLVKGGRVGAMEAWRLSKEAVVATEPIYIGRKAVGPSRLMRRGTVLLDMIRLVDMELERTGRG